ncbi:lamin tail domain-containing protein [Patescibacteria group bacterium]|nr:lamin tail domain-containing protein [Patescibacteria group bacterium]
MKKIRRIGGWLGVVLILFFIIKPSFSQAQTPAAVVINELAWAGSSSSSSDEWIELLNTTGEDVDLTGWQITKNTGTESLMIDIVANLDPLANIIPANGYFLIANNDEDYDFSGKLSVLNIAPNLIDSSITLSNDKLSIKLYQGLWDNGGALQDTAGDGSVPLAGSNSAKTSMERNEVIEDGSLAASWHEATLAINLDAGAIDKATPAAINSPKPLLKPIINNVQPNQAEIDTIFEIENISGDNFSMSGNVAVQLRKGAQIISGTDVNVVSPMLIDNAKFDLSSVEAGDWDLVVINPDLQEGILPNAITLSEPDEDTTYSNKVIITELYPNPSTTSNDEFIEIFNGDSSSVNLNGWKLDDKSPGGSAEYIISSDIILLPGEYRSFTKTITRISLNDTGDNTRLSWPTGTVVSETPNYGVAPKGSAYALFNGSWRWTLEVTKDKENVLELPEVDEEDVLDEEDPVTINIDAEELEDTSVLISFEISYPSKLSEIKLYKSEDEESKGKLLVKLTNNKRSYLVEELTPDTKYFFVVTGTYNSQTILSNQLAVTTLINPTGDVGQVGQVIITEILPNPAEGKEYIELCNVSDTNINITDWRLIDASRKSYALNAFDLPDINAADKDSDTVMLKPNEYILLDQTITGIRLNNAGGETLSLLDTQNNVIDTIEYDTSAKKGNAYVLAPNGDWFWSEELTPGEPNDISFAGFTEDSLMYLPNSGIAYPKYLLGFILFGIIWFQKKKYANLYYN